ncbi:MAG: flagellar biosynthetic protein FliO [Clostridiales Family XIII bacterium]|nr:flagellar biosynthetic protein FliO [Clostridiales Family XIII bacterium]
MWGDVLSIILALVGIAAVLALTYLASRWYAGRAGPMAAGRHIKVIDRLALGKSGSILIIELQGIQYLIGAGDQGVSILKELDEPVKPPESVRPRSLSQLETGFREILGRHARRKGNGL